MNYIQEINNFHNFTETNPLPGATQSLWFLLMHVNNKCSWIEWFSVSNNTLAIKLCMTKKTIIKHREILLNNGLISYKSQQRKKTSGVYKMISLETILGVNSREHIIQTGVKITPVLESESQTGVKITPVLESESQTGVKITPVLESESQTGVKITHITKLIHSISTTNKEIKGNTAEQTCKGKKTENFFNENFHLISPYELNLLLAWLNEFDEEVIILAMQEALKNGVKKVKYIEGILKKWLELNLKTVDDIERHMSNYSKTQKNQSSVVEFKPKNKFHNFKQSEKEYTNEELEIKLGLRK